MRVIALFDDPHAVRQILEHLDLWAPEATVGDLRDVHQIISCF